MPKQYAGLGGRPLLACTLDRLRDALPLDGMAVAIAPDDAHFDREIGAREGLTILRCGGATRSDTVRNALQALAGTCRDDDWILVHDAARPCAPPEALARLVAQLGDDGVGGLLAIPVADTLKRGDADGAAPRVVRTEDRGQLWQAQTPQMFRYGVLTRALDAARGTRLHGRGPGGGGAWHVAAARSRQRGQSQGHLSRRPRACRGNPRSAGQSKEFNHDNAHRQWVRRSCPGGRPSAGPGRRDDSPSSGPGGSFRCRRASACHRGRHPRRAGVGRHRQALSGYGPALARCRQPRVAPPRLCAGFRCGMGNRQRRRDRHCAGAQDRAACGRDAREPRGRPGLRRDPHIVKATTTEHLGFTGREEGIAALATVLLQQRDRNAGP